MTQQSRSGHTPILSTQQLGVHYENRSALRDVTISLYPSETISVLGPNGAGKSTLLKVFAGMIPPSHGSVSFRGEKLTGSHRQITYVPQRSGADWTFPVSVLECTLLGLTPDRPRWRPFSRTDRDQAMRSLEQVGMDRLANAQIGALSGGQQQRVFLARALVSGGDVMLLDEPFTGVDIPTQELLVELFEKLRSGGTTIIYATHDLQQAAMTSDTVLLLNETLVAEGPPAEVLTEQVLRTTFGGQVIIVNTAGATALSPREALTR